MSGGTFDYYDHRCTQLRANGIARLNLTIAAGPDGFYSNYYNVNPRINPNICVTREVSLIILGFSLKDFAKQALVEYYTSVPFVIPSERTFIQAFSTGPTESGLTYRKWIKLCREYTS
jgi:hypothetical protein